uniref:Uncharacterized protein n=1 Tax=Pantoea phage Survivor TaxID=3232176 RepID=A0AAU8L0J0_9CAUD
MFELEITHKKLVARTNSGVLICELIETPVNRHGYSDVHYGSRLYEPSGGAIHQVPIHLFDEPNIKHQWDTILAVHLDLLRKNALLTADDGLLLLTALKAYFCTKGANHSNVPTFNGDRIPFREGVWEHKHDGWTYTLLRRFNNSGYVKDKVVRVREGKEGEYHVEEKQSKEMGYREHAPYPISVEGAINVFK